MSLMEIVERRGSSVASSFSSIRRKKRRSSSNPPPPTSVPEIVQDCHSFSSNDPDEGKRHLRKQAYSLDLSEEGVDAKGGGGGLEVEVGGDPLSRTQSLNVKFRRRESMKKLRKGVGKVWKSLSYSSR